MTFSELLTKLTADTQGSLLPFAPELCIVGTILLLLFVRLLDLDRWLPPALVAIAGAVVALGLSARQFSEFSGTEAHVQTMFTGLLVYDPFTVFFRIFLLLFLLFVIYLTIVTGIPDAEDSPDFYTLLLGSTLGMLLMVSANNLLMVFLAIEMTSLPSYAMAGFLKGRKTGSEAALKYVVYGAGTAGVMLFGISLLAGLLGTTHFPQMGPALMELARQEHFTMASPEFRTLAIGILMVLVGVAFKLSLFPFHFWCPDVFEGAAAEVGGFLSVASKGAAFALLIRFLLALVGGSAAPAGGPHSLYLQIGIALSLIAVVTTTFGNLAAYFQTNIKRLLAYSTIAHAGYMLMAVGSMMVVLNSPVAEMFAGETRSETAAGCVQGLLYYLVVYFFMNLGVFAIVAFVRNATFGKHNSGEELSDYAGLIRQSPVLAICLLICVFSLIGLPPFGGFFGKFMVFYSVLASTQAHWVMWIVLVAGLFNTVFSLFYYLRVLKCAFIDSRPAEARVVDIDMGSDAGRYALLVTVPVVLLGVAVEPISRVAREVAGWLLNT
ncbi:MAG: NADH-quinone oxidoreductase subunit N [Planctomycetota bacterium]|nr:NADH-quinone oxidoreductase subunit N [Planctomycetota bacterium]